jgi:hypothetical protein
VRFKKHKYSAVKTNGYDSKKEANRAEILKILNLAGEITDLQEKVVFTLIPKQVEIISVPTKEGFKEKEICIERACTYEADFVYVNKNGIKVVEDVKGMRLEVYKIKKKLMLFVHGIKINEI